MVCMFNQETPASLQVTWATVADSKETRMGWRNSIALQPALSIWRGVSRQRESINSKSPSIKVKHALLCSWPYGESLSSEWSFALSSLYPQTLVSVKRPSKWNVSLIKVQRETDRCVKWHSRHANPLTWSVSVLKRNQRVSWLVVRAQ